MFGRRAKLIQLVRLIPFVERNYNLVELGPKGTGKSHIFSEFSPHGMLISGGEVTVPKLFVNNSNGRIGLVGYWDVVAFDEFAGKKKRTDKALVDIMKNYMANKSFSRGVETLGAEASMVFVGNTSHTVPYMLKHSDLFDELPESYHDSAYLDRLHHYIPGWEVDIDPRRDVLRRLRVRRRLHRRSAQVDARRRTTPTATSSTSRCRLGHLDPRPRRHPQDLLRADEDPLPARRGDEGGDRGDPAVRDRGPQARQGPDPAHRLDDGRGQVRLPRQGRRVARRHDAGRGRVPGVLPPTRRRRAERTRTPTDVDRSAAAERRRRRERDRLAPKPEPLFEGHREFQENQRGVSYDTLLVPYLRGATEITIVDPYIRQFHQARNLMELIEGIARGKDPADEVKRQSRHESRTPTVPRSSRSRWSSCSQIKQARSRRSASLST